jgi:Zn-finger nucleic acid-binding protein
LSNFELEEKLKGYKCSKCDGCWIKGFQYWKWIKTHGETIPEKPLELTAELPVSDSMKAKVCIECGHLMIKNKVGHGVPFYLDRCTACGGIWFDKNEWDILKSRNLHDEIHLIFTSAWQADNRTQEHQLKYENSLAEILGEKDYNDLRKMKTLINNHPRKDLLLGYILNVHHENL